MNTPSFSLILSLSLLLLLSSVVLVLPGYAQQGNAAERMQPATDGPANPGTPIPHQAGNAVKGREVFRFETFGNEGFWTDAVRLPKGMMDSKLTPKQALEAGLSVDVDALDAKTKAAMAAEFKTDLSKKNAPMLNDPMMTGKLVEMNAVIGMVPKDTNGDGRILAASDGSYMTGAQIEVTGGVLSSR